MKLTQRVCSPAAPPLAVSQRGGEALEGLAQILEVVPAPVVGQGLLFLILWMNLALCLWLNQSVCMLTVLPWGRTTLSRKGAIFPRARSSPPWPCLWDTSLSSAERPDGVGLRPQRSSGSGASAPAQADPASQETRAASLCPPTRTSCLAS